MSRHAKRLADRANSEQNCIHEANYGIPSSRKGSESACQSDGKELVRLYPSATSEEIAGFQEIHGFLEEEKDLQIFKAAASAAGSPPRPSARIAARKSSSLVSCRSSRTASSCSLFSFSASASLGRRPRRCSESMTDAISSSLRSFFMLIKRYSNLFLPSTLVPLLRFISLTLMQCRRYTIVSRWESSSSRRASCLPTEGRSFHASLLRAAVWNL
jgi:hypothetical protein